MRRLGPLLFALTTLLLGSTLRAQPDPSPDRVEEPAEKSAEEPTNDEARLAEAKRLFRELIVDGAPMGEVPWDGSLEPGKHWFALHLGDTAAAPRAGAAVRAVSTKEREGGVIDAAAVPAELPRLRQRDATCGTMAVR